MTTGLPVALNDALVEVEETAKSIQAEIEQVSELIQRPSQALTDRVLSRQMLENLLHPILHRISQVLQVDTVTLLQTEKGEKLTVQATLGLEEEIIRGIQIPVGRGFAGSIAAKRQPWVVNDLSTVEVVSPVLRDKGIQSMAGVPLRVKNRVRGVFHVGTVRPRQFTEEDAHILQLVADRVGLVMEQLEFSTSTHNHLALAQQWPTRPPSQNRSFLVRFHPLPGFHRLAVCWARLISQDTVSLSSQLVI